MKKWVETVDLPRSIEKVVINFLFGLFMQYGLPQEVIIDGGGQFVGHKITTTLRNHHITHMITSSYHPQVNGKVKSTNKVIEAILTKTVSTDQRDWTARLPEALWAYRMTWRNTTRYSLYQLMFNKEPILIEFEIQTLRTAQEVGMDLTEAQTQ